MTNEEADRLAARFVLSNLTKNWLIMPESSEYTWDDLPAIERATKRIHRWLRRRAGLAKAKVCEGEAGCMSTTKFRVGDRVVKNPTGWVPSDFDARGAGVGVGVVIEVYEEGTSVPSLGQYDVRWPAGRATQAQSELLPAPLER